MNKSLLIIDDKLEFIEGFKTIAQRRGFKLSSGDSYDDLENKVQIFYKKITAVVLDIKAFVNKEQPIENSHFIGKALTLLNTQYNDLPRLILTGDEKEFDKLKSIFPDELIYKKDPEDIKRLFEKIDEFHLKHEERLKTIEEKEIEKIISDEEGKHLEFKCSLQYSTKENQKDRSLHFDILKALAGFANNGGGTLIIGVNDNKDIYGLENGDFKTIESEDKRDKYKQLLDNVIQDNLGNSFQSILDDIKFYTVKDKTVCRIIVKEKGPAPTYLMKKYTGKSSYNAFYIRCQASTRELKGDERDEYIKRNWSITN